MAKYAKKKTRLTGVLLVIVFVLILVIAVMVTAVTQRAKYEKQIEELTANHEAEMEALRDELYETYVSQMAKMEQYYEYGGDVDQIELEAKCVAKVMYNIVRNHEESHQKSVAWCIINRVEHPAYPNTVVGVCEQPKQWMGYSDDNPVLTELYDVALAELKIWHSDGPRPVSNEYIYLSWSSKEIVLRDTFEETEKTNYWRMK